jgi:hypothetical protein
VALAETETLASISGVLYNGSSVLGGGTAVKGDSSDSYRNVAAPEPGRPELYNTVLNVNCAEGEVVEWLWTETAEGRYVSGYRIVPIEGDLAS